MEGVGLLQTALDGIGERAEVWVMLGIQALFLRGVHLSAVTPTGCGLAKGALAREPRPAWRTGAGGCASIPYIVPTALRWTPLLFFDELPQASMRLRFGE